MPELCVAMPPEELVEISETGCISSELLPSHFASFTHTHTHTHTHTDLLRLLDGHGYHVSNEGRNSVFCRRPQHPLALHPTPNSSLLTTTKQIIFKTVKYTYNHAFYTQIRCYPGGDTEKLVFGNLFGRSTGNSVTVNTRNNGFRACGIFLVNKRAIPEPATPPPEALSTEGDRIHSSLVTPDRISDLSLSARTTSGHVEGNEFHDKEGQQFRL
jgi:hypothetical protein